ncbi:DUF4007 family protein [Stenotrophomonas rhizophila]|uniref:DUF4007 family protein n=1 Tax=Stenotrophomonas rhizophila TaxID=216778 RepID=UPI00339B123D
MLDAATANSAERTSGDRFSGHESFACRYGWLPKFYDLLIRRPEAVRDDEQVMVALGIGRNMVKSVRFWMQAFGLMVDQPRTEPAPTPFARWLLDHSTGADPYLEDVGSLWLLHWRLAATADLAAWHVGFFQLPEKEVLKRYLLQRLERHAVSLDKKLSATTVRQHMDIFLSTYAASPNTERAGIEERLGSPLQELGLARIMPAGDKEELIEFSRGPWRHLSLETFIRVLLDYWELAAPSDSTISLRSLQTGFGSPGLTLRLDERALLQLLADACTSRPDLFHLSDSAELQAITLVSSDVRNAKAQVGYV